MLNQINNFFLEFNNYIDLNKKNEIKEKYNYLYKENKYKLFKNKSLRKFIKTYKHLDRYVNKHNKNYIKDNINLEIFNNINNHKLDYNQKVAILTDEINNLIIAGAGSGKTLTIVGKIKYLVEIKNVKPKEILCISFTNDSVKSLKEKINYNIEVLTFHKLALKILYRKKYNISNVSLNYIVDEYFYSIIHNNEAMIKKVYKILKIEYNIKKYNNILNSKQFKQIKKIIITFINIFKTNNYNLDQILKIKNKSNKDFLCIVVDIYFLYQQELKSIKAIDFNDMINLAIKEVESNNQKLNYKYIIIDEYQDTSYTRYALIKAIINKTKSKLIAVGDDWQSIYQFTGCDLKIFLNFEKYYGYTKRLYINNTYRNSQELIDTASKFILKNKNQLKKKLKSNKHVKKPIKIIYEEKNILEILIKKLYEEGIRNVLILGRNNNDINKYLTDKLILEKNIIKTPLNISVRYLTIHKSKGLEEECIIIINLINAPLGLPNQLKNSKIIDLLNNQKIAHIEEERRLFYVALTRTQGLVYLVIPQKNKSIFVEELIKESKKNIDFIS